MPTSARRDYFDLTGKVALVTGASTGIGAATARVLAEQGARVALSYHQSEREARETADAIRASGGTPLVLQADARRAGDLQALASRTASELGPIDILVNNAGGLVKRMSLAELTPELWDEIYTLNVKSAVLMSQAVAPSMVSRRAGTIINVGSIAGHHGGGPGAGPYASAKGALMIYTKSLARELAPHGVRVNGVAPGVIDTPFHQKFSTPDMLRSFTAAIPLGRLGTSTECATVIAFLASEAASFLVGETIEINGGQLMQ
jgi:3-oxoacyl-[acyl-carrier protein] reductase